ncbi:IMPACT family protein [Acetobacter sp. AN02]|uniref:IMPACT family protein n=1 Tax=Acetobacter sp. AN02 TaxID=2894186 RepID=UPI0024341C23|nr:IMPACT family protein [Acetobacter sp. AN02]MDG6093841.1 IMPACT family protein [Acetobacter sp. AN02]
MAETLTARAEHEVEIRKSRFLARAAPVGDEDAASAFIREVSDPDARHNCWAWKIGARYRSDDDGEPSGTAGRPILQMIEARGLDRVVVVVTRWFGGIKLGAGGLVRAYGGTAAECLRLAPRMELIPQTILAFHCPFSDHAMMHARLGDMQTEIVSEDFDATGARMNIRVPEADAQTITLRITDLTRGHAQPRQPETQQESNIRP